MARTLAVLERMESRLVLPTEPTVLLDDAAASNILTTFKSKLKRVAEQPVFSQPNATTGGDATTGNDNNNNAKRRKLTCGEPPSSSSSRSGKSTLAVVPGCLNNIEKRMMRNQCTLEEAAEEFARTHPSYEESYSHDDSQSFSEDNGSAGGGGGGGNAKCWKPQVEVSDIRIVEVSCPTCGKKNIIPVHDGDTNSLCSKCHKKKQLDSIPTTTTAAIVRSSGPAVLPVAPTPSAGVIKTISNNSNNNTVTIITTAPFIDLTDEPEDEEMEVPTTETKKEEEGLSYNDNNNNNPDNVGPTLDVDNPVLRVLEIPTLFGSILDFLSYDNKASWDHALKEYVPLQDLTWMIVLKSVSKSFQECLKMTLESEETQYLELPRSTRFDPWFYAGWPFDKARVAPPYDKASVSPRLLYIKKCLSLDNFAWIRWALQPDSNINNNNNNTNNNNNGGCSKSTTTPNRILKEYKQEEYKQGFLGMFLGDIHGLMTGLVDPLLKEGQTKVLNEIFFSPYLSCVTYDHKKDEKIWCGKETSTYQWRGLPKKPFPKKWKESKTLSTLTKQVGAMIFAQSDRYCTLVRKAVDDDRYTSSLMWVINKFSSSLHYAPTFEALKSLALSTAKNSFQCFKSYVLDVKVKGVATENLLEHFSRFSMDPQNLCDEVARAGKLKVLRFLYRYEIQRKVGSNKGKNDTYCSPYRCSTAILYHLETTGKLEIMKFLRREHVKQTKDRRPPTEDRHRWARVFCRTATTNYLHTADLNKETLEWYRNIYDRDIRDKDSPCMSCELGIDHGAHDNEDKTTNPWTDGCSWKDIGNIRDLGSHDYDLPYGLGVGKGLIFRIASYGRPWQLNWLFSEDGGGFSIQPPPTIPEKDSCFYLQRNCRALLNLAWDDSNINMFKHLLSMVPGIDHSALHRGCSSWLKVWCSDILKEAEASKHCTNGNLRSYNGKSTVLYYIISLLEREEEDMMDGALEEENAKLRKPTKDSPACREALAEDGYEIPDTPEQWPPATPRDLSFAEADEADAETKKVEEEEEYSGDASDGDNDAADGDGGEGL